MIATTILAASLLAPLSAATAATADVGETCRGEAATLVGTSPSLAGTEGRDVIVTGSASDVDALGGDDLICAAPGANINLLDIDAGGGNDIVDTTAAPSSTAIDVVLGEGVDTFVGGSATDRVTTGNGRDKIGFAGANADRVDLGPGDDRLTILSWWTESDGLLTGGDGDDTVVADMRAARGEVVVDLSAGRIAASPLNQDLYEGDGHVSLFEAADVALNSESFYYTGLEGGDSLTLRLTPNCCVLPDVHVESLGGDDEVVVDNTMIHAISRIDTGAGSDVLVAARADGSLNLDLTLQRLVTSDPQTPGFGGVPRGFPTVIGVEDAFLMAPSVSMVGDRRDNVLSASSCQAALRGGSGDDLLSLVTGDPWFDKYSLDCKATGDMRGGSGSDRLRGGPGNDRLDGEGGNDRLEGRGGNDRIRGRGGDDILVGGAGRDDLRGQEGNDVLRGNASADKLLGGSGGDKADGGQGRDRCAAERERRCES